MHQSGKEVLRRLRSDLRGVNLLVMGQTVFWDEPLKAVLCRVLDGGGSDTKIVAAIHDADYFSRVGNPGNSESFIITEHDEGARRDIWVAAAETAQLFGSETLTPWALLAEHGIRIERLASEKTRQAFVGKYTGTWGWRGVVFDGRRAPVAGEVKVSSILPRLRELLEWATAGTAASIAGTGQAARCGRELVMELESSAAGLGADGRLSELYLQLLQKYWSRWMGGCAIRAEFCTAMELFRFNRATAMRPRFRILDHFLNPDSRDAARRAYNDAVRDSKIHGLDQFSDVALPFDVVLMREGRPACRGTICVAENEVAILAPCSTVLHTEKPPRSAVELADLVERHLGPNAVIVGKALALVPMILSEWVWVLHRYGSEYVPLAMKMVKCMRAAGVDMELHPILRVEHDAWSALGDCGVTLRLPGHLCRAFGAKRIEARAFAARWRDVVSQQERLLERLKRVDSPDALTEHLADAERDKWLARVAEYVEAQRRLLGIARKIHKLRATGIAAWTRMKKAKAAIQRLEKEKGHVVKMHIRPLRNKLRDISAPEARRSVEAQLKSFDKERRRIEGKILVLRKAIALDSRKSARAHKGHHALEGSPEFRKARASVAAVERRTQLVKLRLVREALLTSRGLRYTAARPCWWWFPMLDGSGEWLKRLVNTATFSFEEV